MGFTLPMGLKIRSHALSCVYGIRTVDNTVVVTPTRIQVSYFCLNNIIVIWDCFYPWRSERFFKVWRGRNFKTSPSG